MHLGVAQLVPDVVEPSGGRHLPGALEHALGHVDAENAPGRRRARRLASREPGSAADVEDLVPGADPVGGAKVLVVGAQFGVVEVQAVRRGHRGDANQQGQRGASPLRPRLEMAALSVTESLLAVDSFRGFDGVRRFWGEFLSARESYRVETLRSTTPVIR
jgi:hypothetical protein